MSKLQDAVFENLSRLVGLRLSAAHYGGDSRFFHFGELSHGVGRYAVHLSCPWRLEIAGQLLTGLGDWYVPAATDRPADDEWEPARGGSLQEALLRELMNDRVVSSRSITNRTENLVVTAVSADPYGGFQMDLSGGVRLVVFPDGSRSEQWRLLQPKEETKHFVVEGGGLYRG